jgi:hypothetical protein
MDWGSGKGMAESIQESFATEGAENTEGNRRNTLLPQMKNQMNTDVSKTEF